MVELGWLRPALPGDVIECLADRRAIWRERHVRAVRQGYQADLIAGGELVEKVARGPRGVASAAGRDALQVEDEQHEAAAADGLGRGERLGSAGARCRPARNCRRRRFALA